MAKRLTKGDLYSYIPFKPFLKLEKKSGSSRKETALEVQLFKFKKTNYQVGARVIYIPPGRAFARHTHPNAYHFIVVLKGTGVLEYDAKVHTLHEGHFCLVSIGVPHKLGAGEDGVLALVVNSPTFESGDLKHVHYLEEEDLDVHEVQ